MVKKFKVVFFGTPTLSASILEKLAQHPDFEVVMVVTQPDKITGRKQTLQSSPVKIKAQTLGLPCLQPVQVQTIQREIAALKPDFLVTCAYGQFISSALLATARWEPLNIHGSLLPAYRGGAPVQHALWNGETKTGVSIMRMVKKMDAGPYFSQQEILIDPDANSGEILEQMANVGAELLLKTIPLIVQGKLIPQIQEETAATFAYHITPDQEKIDWTQPGKVIHNHIRALYPHPVAFTTLGGQRFKIVQARLFRPIYPLITTLKIFQPGEIVFISKNGIVVKTGDEEYLEIIKIQKAGKKTVPAGIYGLNTLKIGERFQ